jgi:transcriptional regulator with XRE-family HTH domain
MTPPRPNLASRLRHRRLQRKMTQEALAARARISANTLQKIEQGKTSSPGIQTLYWLAQALTCSVAYLIGESDHIR